MSGVGAEAGDDWPDDAVEVGRIVDAWGVKGWFKVLPHASEPQALFSSRRWYLRAPDSNIARTGRVPLPRQLAIQQAREHGDVIVAQARDVGDRSAAESLRGARVFVPRSSFPTAGPDEYYWVDLIGLAVVNRAGEHLGRVAGLLDTGAHSVLRVVAEATEPERGAERLIPFVAAYVDGVDFNTRTIRVDWGLDY